MEQEIPAVAIIEDHESTRKALARQIGSAGFRVIDFETAIEFLHSAESSNVDCVVADVHLPMMDGLRLQEELFNKVPYASIVFVTGHAELAVGIQAMRRGATDFLEKPVDDETLLEAIHRGVNLSRERREIGEERETMKKRYDSLTRRERDVFVLITRGLLNKQAAAELGTAERTIKVHRGRVMEKMGAASLADLIRSASVLGIDKHSYSASSSGPGSER